MSSILSCFWDLQLGWWDKTEGGQKEKYGNYFWRRIIADPASRRIKIHGLKIQCGGVDRSRNVCRRGAAAPGTGHATQPIPGTVVRLWCALELLVRDKYFSFRPGKNLIENI